MRSLNHSRTQSNHRDEVHGIQFACEHNPDFGIPFLIAPGIWWVRLPLASSLQAINIYLLEDGNHLTLVDTGVRSNECREALHAALGHPDVAAHRLNKIIVTHYHPDHIGLAGELARDGVELWTSRGTWLHCQLKSANKQLLPLPSEVLSMQRAGLTGIELEAFRRRASSRYSALVAPPPDHFVPLTEGQKITIGKRVWRVAMGYGHAAEHITLWSNDCVLTGDQVLPNITSNLTVPYTESDVDLIGEWLRSCKTLGRLAHNDVLCLPGHQRPFYGILNRLHQIEENIQKTLGRLQSIIVQPTAAIDCIEPVYGRAAVQDEKRTLVPEIVGMLNHLYYHGQLDRTIDSEGAFRFLPRNSRSAQEGKSVASRSTASPDYSVTADYSAPPDHSANRDRPLDAEHRNGSLSSTNVYPRNHAIEILESKRNEERELLDTDGYRESNSLGSRIARLVALTALVVVAGLSYWSWDSIQHRAGQLGSVLQTRMGLEPLDSEQKWGEATIVPVDTLRVVKQSHAEVPRQFTGIVKPRRASSIGFNRIGVIDEILVNRGERVEADAILARLNTHLLEANLKAVEAQYVAAEARLSELVAGPRAQTIQTARAQVAAAQAESDLAKTSLDRARRLVDAGAVSKQDFDNAQTHAAAKAEALKGAQNTLDELLEGTRSEQVAAQRAQLVELEAAKEQLQVQLNESVLRAPFAATISERFVEPGAVAAPGSVAFRLIDAESPEVWIGVPPEFLPAIQASEDLQLTIGDAKVKASWKSVLPELDTVTRTNTVILEITSKNNDQSLFGQIAKIELARKLEMDGFWIPLASLTQGDQGLWALLALEKTEESDRFVLRRREVEIIQLDSDRAFVRGTMDADTELVSTGVRRLTPGQIVTRSSHFKSVAPARDLSTTRQAKSTMSEGDVQ